jgi:transposase
MTQVAEMLLGQAEGAAWRLPPRRARQSDPAPVERRGTADLAESHAGARVERLAAGGRLGYMLRHWSGLVLFLDDGRLEIDTNVVERGMKGVAVARKNALFSGSDGAGEHWAIALTLIGTAKLNGIDPLAYLTDVLERLISG